MINKTDYAVVSEKALRTGTIGYAYKKHTALPKDSGWRMMYDKDEDMNDLLNPDKVYACELGKLLKYFPEIKPFLGEKKFTIAEKNGDTFTCTRTDKELSDVPNKMASKDKYGAIIGSKGPAIFTADPADMKRGMKEWEKLIPQK